MSYAVISSLELRLLQLKISSRVHGPLHPCVQCIRRYRPRKPFWLPMGKSKIFRIPKKPVIPKEEDIELSRLYNVYRTNMKSIRQYFKDQLMAQTTGPEVIEERKQREAEHHANCIKENNVWNAEVAKLRAERLAKEAVKREEEILQKIMDNEEKQKALVNQIDEHIRKEKVTAKKFITPKNIDEAIEIAFVNVVDHNFCIDLEGNIYNGRYGKPAQSPTGKKVKTSLPETEQETSVSAEATN